jgi:kynurenine formamidase
MVGSDANAAYSAWIRELAARDRFGPRDRRGTANYIDEAARRRAAAAIGTGRCVSLARALKVRDDGHMEDGQLRVDFSVGAHVATSPGEHQQAVVTSGLDVVHVSAHGLQQTHMDAFNHFSLDGKWYSGFATDDTEGPAVVDLATHKLFTRGVLADIPSVRGTDWVDPAEPVTGEDIDAALGAAGVTFEPGDALLLYMGRDRYEAAGHHMGLAGGERTPGAGPEAARWIAEHAVSMLCWDFLDAAHESQLPYPVHMLIWAIGLVLVDNCDHAAALQMTKESGSVLGGLVVAPPPLPRASGALVDPLFIQ